MKRIIFILLSISILCACESKQEKQQRIKNYKYVYFDSNNVMHLDPDCKILNSDKKNIKNRVLKTEIFESMNNGNSENTCNICIDYQIHEDFINQKDKYIKSQQPVYRYY